MTLDIIVPHYKENIKTLMTALSSLDNQINHHFKVNITVVTDAGGVDIDEGVITQVMKAPITFITTDKHEGPGYARQFAMDRTTGDYIMFCDSDDLIASPFVLSYFEQCLFKDPDLEIIFSAYLEEYVGEDTHYTQKMMTLVLLHYTVNYIKENLYMITTLHFLIG